MTARAPAILDATGRPLVQSNAHQGARIDRELAHWRPALQSADGALLPDWTALVARTQDLVRNHGMLSGGLQLHLDNIIGSGLRLAAKPDWRALGQSAEWAAEWARNTEAQFRIWSEDPDRFCDAGRRLSLAGMLSQGYRAFMTTGDIVALPKWLDRGGPYRTAIQMIDPARMSNPNSRPDTERLRGGVELDGNGAPVAHHFRERLPDGYLPIRGASPYRWQRVRRETPWGRAQVLHIYDVERADQTRGKSGFASIIARSKMLDRFQSVGLEAAVINAMYAAVIESEFDHTQVQQSLGGSDDPLTDYLSGAAEFYQDAPIRMDGVKIPHMYPGEKLKFTSANHPSPNYADYERGVLRHLAAGLNISYEELARDYSQTNYSGARAGLEQSWKFFRGRREQIGGAFATQIYALWLEEAMDRGDVETPPAAPDFWAAKAAWTRCRWIGPRKGHIDPLKEAKADLLELEAGLVTEEDLAAARGTDWEENLEQRARELKRRQQLQQEYGVQFPGSTAPAIAAAPEPPTE